MHLNEAATLARLAQIKQALIELEQLRLQVDYESVLQRYTVQLEQLAICHRQKKQARSRQRAACNNTLKEDSLAAALDALALASQRDGTERRRLKRERDEAIAPLVAKRREISEQMQRLKQRYQTLCDQWRAQMQRDYFEQNADAGLVVPILYEDSELIVVDKPAGLLAVPGRRYDLQDSVLSRLRLQLPERLFLQAVHRLDQGTSGVMAIATSRDSHAALSEQFARRQVHKIYEAVLSRPIAKRFGTVDLPLRRHPESRPRQEVNFQLGKPSRTDFKVLTPGAGCPKVELIPHTGRTHQLRVHMADPKGLNSPIMGDSLYGGLASERLCLHAIALELIHPLTHERMRFSSPSSLQVKPVSN